MWRVIGLILILLILYLIVTKRTRKFLDWFVEKMKIISSIKEPLRSSIFFCLLIFLQMSYIPFQSTFIVVMSFCLKSFYLSMLLQLLSNLLSCTTTYLLTKHCCNKQLHLRYGDDILYKVVMNESKNHPWKINIMLRVIFIPVAFKNTLVGLANIPYIIVIICYFISLVLMNPVYTLIGVNLDNVEDYINPSSFNNKTPPEKIKIVLGYIFIIFTFGIFLFLYCYTRRKLEEYRIVYAGNKPEKEK